MTAKDWSSDAQETLHLLISSTKDLLGKTVAKCKTFLTLDRLVAFSCGFALCSIVTFESVRRIKGLTRLQLIGSIALTTGASFLVPVRSFQVQEGPRNGVINKILPLARTLPSAKALLFWKHFGLGTQLNYALFSSPRAMIQDFRRAVGLGELAMSGPIAESVEISDFSVDVDGVNVRFTQLQYPGASSANGVILFLPGSAFVVEMSKYAHDALSYMSKFTGMKSYILRYPVSPEVGLEQAFEQVWRGYLHLTQKYSDDRQKLFLCGDSAGGTYSMLLVSKLKEMANIRVPDGVVLMSPPMDLTCGRAAMRKNANLSQSGTLVTHLLALGMIDEHGNNRDGFAGAGEGKEAEEMLNEERSVILKQWSPFYKDFSGMKLDTYWVSSVHEDLFDDTRDMVKKLQSESSGETVYRYTECTPHTVAITFVHVPECRHEIALLCHWINKKSGYDAKLMQ